MRVRQFSCNKVSSQNAPKHAILSSKIEKKSGGGIVLSPAMSPPRTFPRWGGGTPPHTQPLGTFGASFLALAMIRPPLFKPWNSVDMPLSMQLEFMRKLIVIKAKIRIRLFLFTITNSRTCHVMPYRLLRTDINISE